MTTEQYDNIVRYFHLEEGWGWKEAQHRADELIGGVNK